MSRSTRVPLEGRQVETVGRVTDAKTHDIETDQTTCQCPSPHHKNLVVCIDGTANQFSEKVCVIIAPVPYLITTFGAE